MSYFLNFLCCFLNAPVWLLRKSPNYEYEYRQVISDSGGCLEFGLVDAESGGCLEIRLWIVPLDYMKLDCNSCSRT